VGRPWRYGDCTYYRELECCGKLGYSSCNSGFKHGDNAELRRKRIQHIHLLK
jgi:hypothetical protein